MIDNTVLASDQKGRLRALNYKTPWPWFVLALSLAFTIFGWSVERRSVHEKMIDHFGKVVESTDFAIKRRLLEYEQVLRGGVGFFKGSDFVLRNDWKAYVNALHLQDIYPGIQGLGFAVQVLPDGKQAFIDDVRREGFPDFDIKPEGERDIYYPIVYLEPFDWRNKRAFGYDMFSEPVRKAAMSKSRDEGVVTISAKVLLVQETEKDVQAGFLMYAPLYMPGFPLDTVEQRRKAFVGFVYSPFRMEDFMKGGFEGENSWIPENKLIDIEIYDGTRIDPSLMMYDSSRSDTHASETIHRVKTINLYGHAWTMRILAKPAFYRIVDQRFCWMILGGGAIVSFMLFFITMSLETKTARAFRLTRVMSDAKRESEEKYRAIFENAAFGIAEADMTGRFIHANPRFMSIFGFSEEEIRQIRWDAITPQEDKPTFAALFDELREGKRSMFTTEKRCLRKDGGLIWTSIAVSILSGSEGKPRSIVVMLEDVTDMRMAREALKESEERHRVLFEKAGEGIYMMEAEGENPGKIVAANQAAARSSGYTIEELENMRIQDLDTPVSAALVERRIRSMLANGEWIRSEVEHRRKDGSLCPEEFTAGPVEFNGRKYILAFNRDISERKKAEEKINSLKNFYSNILEMIMSGVLVTDRNDIISYANRGISVITGIQPEKFVGMNILEDLGEEAMRHVKPMYIEARETLQPVFTEGVYVAPSSIHGSWQTGWIIPIVRDGAFDGAICTLDDITDQKEAEHVAKQRNSFMQTLIDTIPLPIYYKDADGRYMGFNKKFTEFFNATPEELLGKTTDELFAPETAAIINKADNEVIRNGASSSMEIFDMEINGNKFDMVVNKAPFLNDDGSVGGLVGVNFDITERNRMSQALNRANRYNRSLIEASLDPLVTIAPDGKISDVNGATEAVTGYTRAELIGSDFSDYFTEPEKAKAGYRKVFSDGFVRDYELEIRHKDGYFTPVLYNASVFRDENDEVMGIFAAARDITERRMAERELVQAKEQAEEATKLKDKFVSLVAHDLKSPFIAIMGLLALIERDENAHLAERHRNILRHVMEGGERMLKMIDDLLDISRLKTGKIKPKPKFIDGSMVAATAVNRISLLALKKGVSVLNNIPPGSKLYADPSLFDEVIYNLLTNSVKFCKKGDTITIFIPENRSTTVAVADTGIGINEALLPHLFRHEEKTSTAGTDGELGTGLGLPLSKDLMELQGGDLYAESKEGEGSVFYAELPHVKPVILLVDDEAPVRYLLSQYLMQLDVRILEAAGVEEAFSLLNKNHVHLIISDIMMPDMDGYELLTRVRGNPDFSGAPVILVTADRDTKSREKAFKLGANDFISKPVEIEEFIPRVKRFLS